MTDIAKEIERLADKYRDQKKLGAIADNDNSEPYEISDFLQDDDSDFDENYLSDLEDEIDAEKEIEISEFINPEKVAVKGEKNKDLLEKNNLKPKNQAMNLIRDISRNLRDLKALIRS